MKPSNSQHIVDTLSDLAVATITATDASKKINTDIDNVATSVSGAADYFVSLVDATAQTVEDLLIDDVNAKLELLRSALSLFTDAVESTANSTVMQSGVSLSPNSLYTNTSVSFLMHLLTSVTPQGETNALSAQIKAIVRDANSIINYFRSYIASLGTNAGLTGQKNQLSGLDSILDDISEAAAALVNIFSDILDNIGLDQDDLL